jgi:hypothetical protein
MPTDLRATIENLLPDQDDRLGTIVREAIRPIVRDAFRQGLEIGLSMARDASTNGLDNAEQLIRDAFEAPKADAPKTDAPKKRQYKQYVARGTIGPLINSVLTDSPGLRIGEVEAKVVELDNKITPASVGNELRRYRDKRYHCDDNKRWYLIDDTEKGSTEADSFVNGVDPSVEGPGRAAA